MFTDPELRADPVNYAPVVAHQMMAITVGYLAGDFLVVFSHQKQFGVAISRQTMLHHFIGVVGFSIMILFRVFSWFAIFRLSSEASTVFINIRWMLATNPKWKSSWLYILNGSVMTIVFFAFRVGSLPYYYYVLVDAWPNMVATRETWQIITLLVFGSTIDTLNVYWFSKIWGGLMSMVRPRSKTQ
ncbi:hypothetical protein, variant [Capsaspora owczarzaki ATCC 30864]|nr:hypothetical protein, variant [Capsaspora owczarzaki ATCC 30864]